MTTMSDFFKERRIEAKNTCTCGNKDFVSPALHSDTCPYNISASKKFDHYSEDDQT